MNITKVTRFENVKSKIRKSNVGKELQFVHIRRKPEIQMLKLWGVYMRQLRRNTQKWKNDTTTHFDYTRPKREGGLAFTKNSMRKTPGRKCGNVVQQVRKSHM